MIVAYGDGVISIPAPELPDVVRGVRARVERQHGVRAAHNRGEHLLVLGLDVALDATGLEKHDRTWKDR